MSNKCPKCNSHLEKSARNVIDYNCGTWINPEGVVHQSDRCRIAELKAKLAKVQAENAELRAHRERLDFLELRYSGFRLIYEYFVTT